MTLTWVTVHDTGGGWARTVCLHPIFHVFFENLKYRIRMAAAVPKTKTSMFPMSTEHKNLLDNRMTAQYSGETVIDDEPRKRVTPTVVRSVRWMHQQFGVAGFPVRVDEEYWRAYM